MPPSHLIRYLNSIDLSRGALACPLSAFVSTHKPWVAQALLYQPNQPVSGRRGHVQRPCPLKERCTPSEHGRTLNRHFDEAYLERVRGYFPTAAYQKALSKRRVWVEPLFGEAKAWHGGERFRLRTLPKVNIEGVLIAAGQT